MGTNYYVETDKCPHCGRSDERVHIGKSSAGWCFSLNTHRTPVDDYDIQTLNDWRSFWEGKIIVDEYGDQVSEKQMLITITERWWEGNLWTADGLAVNFAELGPHGLARHKIDGRRCIGHGDGTFDYMRGEFS